MNRILVIGAFLVFISGVFGQGGNNPTQKERAKDVQLNTITTAVPFMLITPDSRSGAMGDVGLGLSPDANSIYWNTAKLAFAKPNFEIALSYSPWLRQLTNDIHLSYLSFYTKIGKRHTIGGSLRYFSLGEITFTDITGNTIRNFVPNEFALQLAYSFKLSDKFALGLNGSFIYSNLTGGISVVGANTKAGIAGAADVSFIYYDEEIKLGQKKATVSAGITFSNIGNKIKYTETSTADFLPTNMRIGSALKVYFDDYNSLTTAFDINKLLVPTPPRYGDRYENGDTTIGIIAGKDPDVGVAKGIFQSFNDAPGQALVDENGATLYNDDGTEQIKKGSRSLEELREINIALGFEYWYKSIFSFRTGFFYEHPSKGARQFLTFGVGLHYKVFGIDFSYLASLTQNSPLANTIRFTLSFKFNKGQLRKQQDEETPE
ncbi:MAG: type IX secretion system outer membrane channel protein PorV [Crocinitomicaceae bacterium]|nr:type IX secretion system outer membrane channel protein PorV [Crocinitomicaceae bacterium]